jgi:hypothetical protein
MNADIRLMCIAAVGQVRALSALLLALAIWGLSPRAASAELQFGSCDAHLTGPIAMGDATKIARQLSRATLGLSDSCRSALKFAGVSLEVRLDSAGGDLEEAMLIGRLFRREQVKTFSVNCLSACVMVYLGGVVRRNWGPLGVHRPYFRSLAASETYLSVSQKRSAQIASLRAYVEELGGSPALVDLMESIPPERLLLLTDEERIQFRLDGEDPAWEEIRTADKAAVYGLTSQEYRQRRRQAETECPPVPEQWSWQKAAETRNCEVAVFWGISAETLARLQPIVATACGVPDRDHPRSSQYVSWLNCAKELIRSDQRR